MQNIIIKENQEINELAMEYKRTGDEEIFSDLYYAVQPLSEKIAYSLYHEYRAIAPKEEFVNIAEFTVFDAIKDYDSAKGGSFTAFLKKSIRWKVNDNIIKPFNTKREQFNREVLCLDQPLNSGEGTFLDAVEHKASTNLESYDPAGNDIDAVFNLVVDREVKNVKDELTSLIRDLATNFAKTAKDEESLIIRTVVAAIIIGKATSKKEINAAVEQVLPNIVSATVRKKKSRTMQKFNDFAKEQGFVSFDLSQF